MRCASSFRPFASRVAQLWLLLMLGGCSPPAGPPLPEGWPLPQLGLPDYARPVAASQFAPPDRPYYAGDSQESIQPAVATQQRLIGQLAQQAGSMNTAALRYSNLPVLSMHGQQGRGWGIAFMVPGGGWDQALARCETALASQRFETVKYVPGMLRVYYSGDRRTEVVLVAGRGTQLLLAVNLYDPPLPSERELAQLEDARAAALRLAESIKTHVLEMEFAAEPPAG